MFKSDKSALFNLVLLLYPPVLISHDVAVIITKNHGCARALIVQYFTSSAVWYSQRLVQLAQTLTVVKILTSHLHVAVLT